MVSKLQTIRFTDTLELSSEQHLATIRESLKTPISELTISDIARVSDNSPHGVYLFFTSEGECVYVGKTSSRSFIDRIPCHFGRPDEWMSVLRQRIFNNLCTANGIVPTKQKTPENEKFWDASLEYVLQLNVLLIPIPLELDTPEAALKLERNLHESLNPTLIRKGGRAKPKTLAIGPAT